MGNLFLAMEIDYGMSSFIGRNKLPTLWPNSYLHTQASEIQVENNYTFLQCIVTREITCYVYSLSW